MRDSRQTGWFITLFLIEIDPARRRLTWIRAGHEPGLLYEPQSGRFRELGGEGVALGVVSEPQLTANRLDQWHAGTIIILATDGIREASNTDDEMFGAARLKEVIRAQAKQPADVIVNAVIRSLEDFQGSQAQQDDITLVAIKLR